MTVISLGALCDYVSEDEYRAELLGAAVPLPADALEQLLVLFRSSASFKVAEFALLDDGRRVALGDDSRRFSRAVDPVGAVDDLTDAWDRLTTDTLEAAVRTLVTPEEEGGTELHPWEWLVEQLAVHGVTATVEELQQVDYRVEFSDRLVARLG
ncbi:hypothetical protein [Jatrophihabitans sp.]|uniref:hypothetical protein n=1 Tax=Jatrophihabitans sp. TaxID=1932789 RepID=UPI0030C6E841|nr:hypothetical protein [Jatrophihabitans sp.]